MTDSDIILPCEPLRSSYFHTHLNLLEMSFYKKSLSLDFGLYSTLHYVVISSWFLIKHVCFFFRFTKPQSFADCIGNELPLGWEEAFDPHIGPYYINHVNRKYKLNFLSLQFFFCWSDFCLDLLILLFGIRKARIEYSIRCNINILRMQSFRQIPIDFLLSFLLSITFDTII